MTPYQVFGRKVQSVCNTALQVTPIISRQSPPVIENLGSGLFLQIDDDYYLVSAGHLLNLVDWANLLVPGNNNQMVWLNGTLVTTFDRPNLISNIDFAVLQFSQSQVKHLVNGHYAFIKPHHILINHKLKYDDNYVIAGYPVNAIKKHCGKPVYEPKPLKFVTYPIKEKKYAKFGFNPEYHVLVKYQRELKSFSSMNKQLTVEARGISGSGLWFVPNWNNTANGVPEFFLTGIMIENYKDKGFLTALRIDFVIEAIRQVFNKKQLGITKIKVDESINALFCAKIP
jgi:hypothetical protein